MRTHYNPAESVALENWPVWMNAIFGGIVLAFVIAVIWITGLPPVSKQQQAQAELAACELRLEAAGRLADAPSHDIAQLQAACAKLREDYHRQWGSTP